VHKSSRAKPDPANLREFYDAGYVGTGLPEDADRGTRWRELGAVVKADHICQLLTTVPNPQTIIEVGCGNGAVLAELGRRGVGQMRVGVDISSAAIRIAASQPGVTEAQVFDGEHIEARESSFDLAICTHVLEHVVSPIALVEEMVRVSGAVVIEVPLEDNLLARRSSARVLSENAGHLQRFNRRCIRRLIADVGWAARGELVDPLPLAVHLFDAQTPQAVAKAHAKWAVRAALGHLPLVGERLMTLHYAVLATPRDSIV